MGPIEKSAKTVKEAIRLGLEELGMDSMDVDIEVLEMGNPGIFGMFSKPAKVRLTPKTRKGEFEIDMPTLSLDQSNSAGKTAKKPQPKKEQPVKEAPRKEQREEQPAEEREQAVEAPEAAADEAAPKKHRNRHRSRKSNANQEPSGMTESPVQELAVAPVEEEPFEPTPEEALSDSAKKAREFISGLTDRMGAPVTMEMMETPEQLRIRMAGENMSLLIGRRGETLDGIQYLTSLCVNRGREEYLRISLDTENYRAKREEALRKLAVRMANRARRTGKRVAMEPMNPYERRILHSALQDDPDVATHSEGEEPYRRVIITLK